MNKSIAVLAILLSTLRSPAAGTWVPLANPPPMTVGHFLLLSDGTVMGIANPYGYGSTWLRLTPDIHGSYVNGTWSTNATMSYTRLDFASDVLPDGRLFVAGGEYGTGTTNAEIYSPVSNTWSTVSIPSGIITGSGFVDSDSVLVGNGKVLITPVYPAVNGETATYDPVANLWATAQLQRGNDEDEAGSVKLPDGSILLVDSGSTNSERYIPSSNTWVNDANVPVQLYDTIGTEEGPGLLLPNGKAIFFGGTSHTAIYTPSGTTSPGAWVAGPDFPNSQGMPDSPGAMMVNGKILCAVEHIATNGVEWAPPVSFYEYDYIANSFTQVGAPSGGNTFNDVCWPTLMLDLPDGSVLFGHRQTDFYIYQPNGVPLAAGKPTISSITTNADGSLHLTGKLFNGLCQGAAYGDDEQMDSNFPLVRFIDASGNIRYGRTYNWSNTGVMTSNQVVSTDCTLPAGASLSDNIQVVANGIESGYNPIVENTSDSGPGSLRQLLSELPTGYTITFASYLSGSKILLTSGELLLTNSLTIDASALPGGIRIDGNGTNRVFEVDSVTVALKSLTITNGGAGASYGGGILNYGTVILSQCTLSGNSAYQGGAIENSGTCLMTNCTLALNVSTVNGAAVDDNVGSLSLTHCTVVGNTTGSGGSGGGIANYLRTATLLNSIVAGNSASFGADIRNFGQSTVIYSGANLVQVSLNDAGSTNAGPAPITSPPLLAPLGNYGGPTLTMTPQPGSPAIDAAVATSLTIDQRGYPRPVGPAPDLGAVEYETSPLVTTSSDSGIGSLRYTITYTTNGSTITFNPGLSGSTVLLASGQLLLNKSLTIDASALPAGITINGNGASRVFAVTSGSTVTLNSLAISNGYDISGTGGGILNGGALTLNLCTLSQNNTTNSAAVDGLGGGALYNQGTGNLTVNESTLSGNSALAYPSRGGGIFNLGMLTVNRSTVCSNSANFSGGGVFNNSSLPASAVDSTLAANSSTYGGGIDNYAGTFSVDQCTVVGNSAPTAGGGIYNFTTPAIITMSNSVIALNSSSQGADIYNQNSVILGGANIIQSVLDNGGTTTGPAPVSANPLLAPLANYGGPTQTMPPLYGSPAIDEGSDAAAVGIAVDQRGYPRISGPHVDIGAVELLPNVVILTNADSGYGSLRYAVTYGTSGSTLTFAPALSGQSILLTSGEMLLTQNLTIDGSALPGGITINGNHSSQIFGVAGSVTAVLDSLTLINGYAGGGSGGAIVNSGTLTLNRCTLAGNSASGVGGAIYNSGPLTLTACTLANNLASFAGAIQNYSPCTMVNCTLAGNYATNNGGAIDSDFSAVLALTQCTFSGNTAGSVGGAVDNYLATMSIANSILAGNNGGGDLYSWSASTVDVYGTNIVPALVSLGTNGGSGAVLTSAPLLDPLGNYGGPTQTMPPQPGSPASDAGSDAVASGILTDQRGYNRRSGSHVDIGAVEVQIASAPYLLGGVKRLGNGSIQFGLTNLQGGSFSVFASTNVTLPFDTWSNLGTALETPVGSGQFQFTDPYATNYLRRFYRVRSP